MINSGISDFTKWPIQRNIKCQNSYTKINVRKGSENERIVEKIICINPRNKEYVKRQIQIMQKIDCAFVIKCLHSEVRQQSAHIFMPYFENGDLEQYISQVEQIPLETKMRMLIDILVGLKELHSRFIIHRDIKLKNIFVDSKHRCVLGDLGIVSVGSLTAQSKIGTVGYQAPQVYQDDYEEYDSKIDMWAMGIISYQLLNQKKNGTICHPFCSGIQLQNQVFGYGGHVIYQKYKQLMSHLQPFDPTIPAPLAQMVQQMLKFNPLERISYSQLYSSQYLAPYDNQNHLFSFGADYKQIESIIRKVNQNLQFIIRRKQIFIKMDKLYRNMKNYEEQAIVKDNSLSIYQYYYLLMRKIEDKYNFIKQQKLTKLINELKDFIRQVKTSFKNTDIRAQMEHWCSKSKKPSIENNLELLSSKYFLQLEQKVISVISNIEVLHQK